jgi:hypothetical protein
VTVKDQMRVVESDAGTHLKYRVER